MLKICHTTTHHNPEGTDDTIFTVAAVEECNITQLVCDCILCRNGVL
jgi:hypothetical protein